MSLPLLVLLTLLSPGGSFWLQETKEDGSLEAPGVLLARSRRQLATEEDLDTYDQYEGTDPPEMFENGTEATTRSPKLQAVTGNLGQRGAAGPRTPEPATVEVTTGDAAGLDARGAATGNLSMESATQRIPAALGPLTKEPVTMIPPKMGAPFIEQATLETLSTGAAGTEAPPTQPVATEALPTQPAATEALPTQPAATEALTTQSAATEALTTQPAATEALTTQPTTEEALTTQPAATEALTTQSAATEALPTQPAATEALTTQPSATEAPSMPSTVMKSLSTEPASTEAPSTEPAITETLPKDPATMKSLSTQPATTKGLIPALVGPSDPHRGTTIAASKQGRDSQGLSPRSSVPPSPTTGLDYVSVKHCLLAILVLALVATTFLVCTVVLAIRLSRKKHTYPVRSYSPTEMVCISALLPESGEAPAVTGNGSLPTAKGLGLKQGPQEDRDGDDLTLHSFLP